MDPGADCRGKCRNRFDNLDTFLHNFVEWSYPRDFPCSAVDDPGFCLDTRSSAHPQTVLSSAAREHRETAPWYAARSVLGLGAFARPSPVLSLLDPARGYVGLAKVSMCATAKQSLWNTWEQRARTMADVWPKPMHQTLVKSPDRTSRLMFLVSCPPLPSEQR